MLKRRLFILFTGFIFFFNANATHNRAGEITYKRIEPYTKVVGGATVQNYRYLITVVKYTDEGPGIADRCESVVYFGDGDSSVVLRANGSSGSCGCNHCGELIIQEGSQGSASKYWVKKNVYTVEHTYPGPGAYYIRNLDPNRNEGVHNIPNSINVPFYLESLLIIKSFSGANTSPVFSFLPIDKACVGECFYHNPGAYDPDQDDSLSYEISTPRGVGGQPVAGYTLPEYSQTFNLDARTGKLTWCTPVYQDEYNIAFIVKEWRKNTSGTFELIGYVLRDMQVIVGDCRGNHPPQIEVPPDTCVEAGTLIEKNLFVSDPNNGDAVLVEGGGGAFAGSSPHATMSNTGPVTTYTTPPGGFYTKFRWQTTCDHVRKQPYLSTFKVTDNGSPIKQVSFKTYLIRVMPPAIKNVTAVPVGSAIKVTWDLTTCSPTNNPMKAYQVYRKNDCSTLTPSPCETGVPALSGFILVGEVPVTGSSFVDDNHGNGLVVGQNYSYLVIGVYNDGTETYGSSAICTKLKRDVPVMLNVDVENTSTTNGSAFVRWTLPLTTPGNLDLTQFPGPYRFNLLHRPDSAGAITPVFTTTSTSLFALETTYVHTQLNTAALQHNYAVEFISGTDTIGRSQLASSIYVKAVPSDRKITLVWHANTPWNNKKYTIWRKSPQANNFVEVGSTSQTTYSDSSNIANRNTYCYFVTGEGEYSDPGILRPLINKSQQFCAEAIDLTPPCTPTLQVEADCPTGFVQVAWTDVRTLCSDDVVKYILSYKPTVDGEYITKELDTTVYFDDNLTFISGCYVIQAVDSSGNISPRSPDYCIDNCPQFELPNIFSPNGDGSNDHFMAIKVRQISEIDLNVFDRWGNLVYHTRDPYFKWNSRSLITGLEVSEGTFFYTCHVYEPRVKGVVQRILKGTVQLVR